MQEKFSLRASQLFNFTEDSYLERSSRPVYAVFFLLPFLVFYEIGSLLVRTEVFSEYWQGRVIAFSWLERFLEVLGFSSRIAWAGVPILVIIILVSLHLASGRKWKVNPPDIGIMWVECAALSIPLLVLTLFLSSSSGPKERQAYGQSEFATMIKVESISALQENGEFSSDEQPGKGKSLLADIVTGIGAGIYEELVFRLVIICLLMIVLQDLLRFKHTTAIISAVLISAALFSAYHNIDFFSGERIETFNMTRFGFRLLAGVYFAFLFAIRGFGITAGTHAFYDIIATVINTSFFEQ